jgi:hypothetical protein
MLRSCWLGEAEQSAELGLRLKGWGGVDAKILVMHRVVFPAKILVISPQKKLGSFTTNINDK